MKFEIEDIQRGEVQCYQGKGHGIWEIEPIRVLLKELVFKYLNRFIFAIHFISILAIAFI